MSDRCKWCSRSEAESDAAMRNMMAGAVSEEREAVVRYLTNHPDEKLRTYALILGHEIDRGEHKR